MYGQAKPFLWDELETWREHYSFCTLAMFNTDSAYNILMPELNHKASTVTLDSSYPSHSFTQIKGTNGEDAQETQTNTHVPTKASTMDQYLRWVRS